MNRPPNLRDLVAAGAVERFDARLARALAEMVDETDDLVLAAVAMVSRRTRDAHVCLDIEACAGRDLVGPEKG